MGATVLPDFLQRAAVPRYRLIEDGLPVFRGIQARKELVRRFGLPNAAPGPGETPFGNTRCVFVDDWNAGKRSAYLDPDR